MPHSTESSARLTLWVKPRSKETKLVRELDGTLTVFVNAAPEKGKANRELLKWVASKIGQPSSCIRLVAGSHSNLKILEVLGMQEAEVAKRLGVPAAK